MKQTHKTRSEKLTALQQYMNLETGRINESSFTWEASLYAKAVKKKSLDAQILKCRKCPGLNIKRLTECACGWGDLNSPIFFIGQSLHKPGVVSGLPFILGSGYMLDAALRLSGLLRKDIFISNTIHCHPERNRASTEEERKNCEPYLWQELDIVQPKLIIALGNDAKAFIDQPRLWTKQVPPKIVKVKHPASFAYSEPEGRYGWIVKMSLELDKVLKEGVK
jgi:DNA polymerase